MKNVSYKITLFTTFFMTGIIWFIQIVQYPSFVLTDPSYFQKFHHFHSEKITFIVAPIMILELIFTLIFAIYQTKPLERIIAAASFLLIVLIFISTILIQVPIHNQLSANGKNIQVINELISTNWTRTILWTLKSGLLICLFLKQQKNHSEF